ncbi:MAG: SRPBCC family protein [Roseimicrobium sp.]
MFWIVFGVAFSVAGLVTLAVVVFGHYGFSLFVLIPAVAGFASAWMCNMGREWAWRRTIATVSLTLATTGFLMLGLEGAVCILMASGLAGILAFLGAAIAWLVSKLAPNQNKVLFLVCLLCPLTMGFEQRFRKQPPLLEQSTEIVIDAPPDVVWSFVPAFPRIDTAPGGLLGAGLAYPVVSTIQGEGVGARRSCVLSTGEMPEVITRWEPGSALELDVLATPPVMVEMNPLLDVHPPHVEGYFTVKRGRFLLVPLSDGRTRVEGTSWFRHDLWPQFYWAPITRGIVKQVHERVLEHIKQLSEQAAQ